MIQSFNATVKFPERPSELIAPVSKQISNAQVCHLGCLGTPDVSPAPKRFFFMCMTLK